MRKQRIQSDEKREVREDIILGFPRRADVDIVEAERAYGVPHRITRRTGYW